MSPMLNFALWVLLLAGLLFFPVAHLIWIVSVRRVERRLGRELAEDERQAQKRRARFIAALLVLAFSWLYNMNTVGLPGRE